MGNTIGKDSDPFWLTVDGKCVKTTLGKVRELARRATLDSTESNKENRDHWFKEGKRKDEEAVGEL